MLPRLAIRWRNLWAATQMKNPIVHKEGEEGTLMLDATTGKIVTPTDQQPDWAEGLTTGLIQERTSFYEKRFGKKSTAFRTMLARTEAIEYSDLGWIGVDASGAEKEIFADPTHRSEVVAKVLNIDTDVDTADASMSAKALAEREVSRENRGRTQSEIEALESSVNQGFTGETTRQQTERERLVSNAERQTGTR